MPLIIFKYKHRKRLRTRNIYIVTTRHVGKAQSLMVLHARNPTTEGHIAQNEMDTHADTCCAGANWSLLELTGEVCDVNPFLNSYQPMNEIPVA